jgi:hypothetical protein
MNQSMEKIAHIVKLVNLGKTLIIDTVGGLTARDLRGAGINPANDVVMHIIRRNDGTAKPVSNWENDLLDTIEMEDDTMFVVFRNYHDIEMYLDNKHSLSQMGISQLMEGIATAEEKRHEIYKQRKEHKKSFLHLLREVTEGMHVVLFYNVKAPSVNAGSIVPALFNIGIHGVVDYIEVNWW